MAIETRADDRETNALLADSSDPAAAQALEAERALVAALGGGCQLPLGAIALHDGDDLDMHAVVASVDGRRQRETSARGPARLPVAVGTAAGRRARRGGRDRVAGGSVLNVGSLCASRVTSCDDAVTVADADSLTMLARVSIVGAGPGDPG